MQTNGNYRPMAKQCTIHVQGGTNTSHNRTRNHPTNTNVKRNQARMSNEPHPVCQYVEPITRELRKHMTETQQVTKEPCMLLYADDMVVWAETKKELQQKLQIVIGMMDKLGLEVSVEKTELQTNEKLAAEEQDMNIKVRGTQQKFGYVKPDKHIRYLGAWLTVNLEEQEGLEKLKAKVQDRIDRIEKLHCTATTRSMLLKARVLSVINYTAAIQKIDKEQLDKWEKQIYRAMTKKERNIRKDIVYEKAGKGGMDMTDIREEYKINRLRGLLQMIQTADTQAGRGQSTWIQETLIEELQQDQPCLAIIQEMKDIMEDIGVESHIAGKTYKPWTLQEKGWQKAEGTNPNQTTMKLSSRQGRLDINTQQITHKDEKVPVHLVRWHEYQGATTEEAMKKATKDLQSQQTPTKRRGTMVRIQKRTMEKMEDNIAGPIGEVIQNPHIRSTNLQVTEEDITLGIPKAIIINKTGEQELTSEEEEEQKQIRQKAATEKTTVIIISHTPERGSTHTIKIDPTTTTQLAIIDSRETPKSKEPINKEIWISTIFGDSQTRSKIIEALQNKETGKINNMYRKVQIRQKWTCPGCNKEGARINQHFGKCMTPDCLAVATEHTARYITTTNQRKVEVVRIEHRKSLAGAVRSFWTDGSGKRLEENREVLQTGWAAVEVTIDKTEEEFKLTQKEAWRGRSKALESVQRCEIRAILKVAQTLKEGEMGHIHTDSKVTVQMRQEIMSKGSYKRKRKMKTKS